MAEISEEDCWKEGMEEFESDLDYKEIEKMIEKIGIPFNNAPLPHFAAYWNATHKKPEEKFEASPWVWVINFEVVK